MRKINYILLLVVFVGLFPIEGFSQIPEKMDTNYSYIFNTKVYLDNGDCILDDKVYPKEICNELEKSFDYLFFDTTIDYNNLSVNDIKFIRYIYPNKVLKHTQYQVDPELGPFGEYINYYTNGKVKSIWHFEEPNDSLTNYGVMTGDWWYFNEKGDTVGVKRFKNDMAHGKWVAWLGDTIRIVREYKNGLSHGVWNVDHYTKYSSSTRPYIYHNGFYSTTYGCNEVFESFLDIDENVYEKYRTINYKGFKYGKSGNIEVGKFQIVRDGIITEMKEFKEGNLVKHIKYDYK